MTKMITIKNINDAPVVQQRSLRTKYVWENSGDGTKVGSRMQASDEDGDRTYWWLQDSLGRFQIGHKNGQIRVALKDGNSLNFEERSKFTLAVICGDRPERADPSILTHKVEVPVRVLDKNEVPSCADFSAAISEDAPTGTLVDKVIVNDVDDGQSYLYSIVSGNTRHSFTIDELQQVSLQARKGRLDFESVTMGKFTLGIRVQDVASPSQVGPSSLVGSCTLTVNVTMSMSHPFLQMMAPRARRRRAKFLSTSRATWSPVDRLPQPILTLTRRSSLCIPSTLPAQTLCLKFTATALLRPLRMRPSTTRMTCTVRSLSPSLQQIHKASRQSRRSRRRRRHE